MRFMIVLVSIFMSQRSDIEDLLAKLASNKFKEREKSQEMLMRRMDLELYNKLKKKRVQDLEQRRRILELVTEFENQLCAGLVVNLEGYRASPQIDEGMPQTYTYKGMTRWEIISHYLTLAGNEQCWVGMPHYPQYRRAFDIWMSERISEAWTTAMSMDSEEAIRTFVKKESELISRDTKWLIQGDKNWYLRIGVRNPYCD